MYLSGASFFLSLELRELIITGIIVALLRIKISIIISWIRSFIRLIIVELTWLETLLKW